MKLDVTFTQDSKNFNTNFSGVQTIHGKDGVGVESIEQTTTSTESGGENIITATLTNGEKSEFVIRNGKDGRDGKDGKDGKDAEGGADRETITKLTPLKELKNAQNLLQDAFSVKSVENFEGNTALIRSGTRAEVYSMAKQNLLFGEYENGQGNFIDHFNPLPPGKYVFYVYDSGVNSWSFNTKFTFKVRRDKTKQNAEDLDNLLVVAVGAVKHNTPYYFDAPDGVDYITTEGGTTSAKCIMCREEDYSSIVSMPLSTMETKNLMPYPYQYDYVNSGYDIINSEGKKVKSGVDRFVTESNTKKHSVIIDTIKFTDEGDGSILVERADTDVANTTKNSVFYFHYGTEVQLPPGIYTFACKAYNAVSGTLWGATSPKIQCRVLARWEDGDSTTYYTSPTMQKITNDKPYTFDAYNGINSILCAIYVQNDITEMARNGLRFKPVLYNVDKKNPDKVVEFVPYDDRNVVYRYSKNLLRSSSPRLCDANYDNNAIGTLGDTQNGITLTKLGGGYFALNGTATAYTKFQIGIGRRYMNPVGTLKFGSLPDNAPNGIELRMTVGHKNRNAYVAKATAGKPATITSTEDNPMAYYTNTLVVIPKGTVCDNVLIAWQLTTDDASIETFDRFRMPVAVTGNNPLIYEYYKVADATYIGNPKFNISAKVWRPMTNE